MGQELSLPIAIAALCVSTLALVVATLNYRRKSGVLIRGSYSLTSSINTNDAFINRVVLENLKDRAVTVFAIYLKIGHSYYLELRDDETRPLILKPFETYTETYGEVQFHVVNTRRIVLQDLLNDHRIKKRIVLSTSDGKYIVPSFISTWNPTIEYFRNLMTSLVQPVYCTYKGVFLGENVRFVIEFSHDSGEPEIVPVLHDGHDRVKFRGFTLTSESLESKGTLERLLQEQFDKGVLTARFVVHDLKEWRAVTDGRYSGEILKAEFVGFFRYYVFGSVLTKYESWKTEKKNARLHRASVERAGVGASGDCEEPPV